MSFTRSSNFWLLLMLAILLTACSGGSGPIQPGPDPDQESRAVTAPPPESMIGGRSLLMAYNVTCNFETQEITLAPLRSALAHYDIRPLLMNPWFCPANNCIQLQFLEFDPVSGYFKIKATLINPTSLAGNDVRGIIFDNDQSNHSILNPDDYTRLWAGMGYDYVYPFKAFAKNDPDRTVHAMAAVSEIYEFQFDTLPPIWSFPYAIDCSWPDNCEEPYEIYNQTQIGDFYSTHGCTKFTAQVSHHSGPAYVSEVQLDATSLTGEILDMEYDLSEDIWETMVINEAGNVSAGLFDLMITAKSPGTDVALYDFFQVEVFPSEMFEQVSGTIYGQDTMEGLPLARMTTSDGDNIYSKDTDFCGYFGTNDVPQGSRVFSLTKPGYYSRHLPDIVEDDPIILEEYLDVNPGIQPDMPVIQLDAPNINLVTGIADISGTILNLDCNIDQVGVYVHQGFEYLMDVDDSTDQFDQPVILTYGHNEIVIRGTNATGTVLSEKIEIDYFPEWNFRVTLTWDQVTDMDLHMWEPDLVEHCYWLAFDTNSTHLDLDIDIISEGYGPENITPRVDAGDMPIGIYPVAVDYYSGSVPVTNTITLRLNVGTPEEEFIQFQHVLTVPDAMDYPVQYTTNTWWRVCDLVMSDDGLVTWQEPDTTLVLWQ